MRLLAPVTVAACSILALLVAPSSVLGSGPGVSCRASMLSGSFRVVPGSPGAGQITYALGLRNRSTRTCFVSGIPGLALRDSAGRALPTHARFVGPRGALSAVVVPLAPGRSASLSARFSPDVPGPGEPQTRACEPKATGLRVAMSGGGTLIAPVSPPTAVCEHGSMQITTLHAN